MVVVVECPRCHRPMGRLLLVGDRVEIAGTTGAENGDPGGTLTSHLGGSPRWAARRTTTDASVPAGTATTAGRVTFSHTGGSCSMRRVVTLEARTAAYHRAVADGRKRISLLDLTTRA